MLPLVTVTQTKADASSNVRMGLVMKRLCSSGTDNLFRCALRHWDTGVVKPGGTVTSRHHLLDIRVGELSLAYQALLVQRGRI